MHNDTIQGNDWQYREPLPPNETFSLYTSCPSTRPARSPIRCSFVFVCLVPKHQHFWIRHKICYTVHVDRTETIVTLQSLARNVLVREMKLTESACKCG